MQTHQVVDGRALATRIAHKLNEQEPRSLAIFVVGSDPVTETFVRAKTRFAHLCGAHVDVVRFPSTVQSETIRTALRDATHDGIIVQLPLPSHIKAHEILDAIPSTKDVDVLSTSAFDAFEHSNDKRVPPVAGAVYAILQEYAVPLEERIAVVVGKGHLVGRPTAVVLERAGAHVFAIDSATSAEERHALFARAEIIVSGAGVPDLVTPHVLQEGVVLIDAGTSSSNGVTRGDIDPVCAQKASLFSPTPGGVGPVTVAKVFENLYID